jgi:hypothetical protein
MSVEAGSHDLVPQTPAPGAMEITTGELERRVLTAAGRAANRAAAHHVFADYRQRRAEKTLRTQRAALMLWVQYLVEAGAADELLTEAEAWALANSDEQASGTLGAWAGIQSDRRAASEVRTLPII